MAEEKPVVEAPVETKVADKPVETVAKAPVETKPAAETITKPATEVKTETKAEVKPSEELKSLLDEAGKEEVKLGPDGKPIVASVVPEKYEFKLPEGMTLDSAKMAIVEPLFKELGLSQESAQKLVDYQIQAQKDEVKRAEDAHVAQWEQFVESQKQRPKPG